MRGVHLNGALSGLARVVQVEHGHTGRGAGDAATELAAFGLRRVGVGLSINERARARANPTKCYPRVTNHSEARGRPPRIRPVPDECRLL